MSLDVTRYPLNFFSPFLYTINHSPNFELAYKIFPRLTSRYPTETATAIKSVLSISPRKFVSSNPLLRRHEQLILQALDKRMLILDPAHATTGIPHFLSVVFISHDTLQHVLKYGAVIDPSERVICTFRSHHHPNNAHYCKDCLNDFTLGSRIECIKQRDRANELLELQ